MDSSKIMNHRLIEFRLEQNGEGLLSIYEDEQNDYHYVDPSKKDTSSGSSLPPLEFISDPDYPNSNLSLTHSRCLISVPYDEEQTISLSLKLYLRSSSSSSHPPIHLITTDSAKSLDQLLISLIPSSGTTTSSLHDHHHHHPHIIPLPLPLPLPPSASAAAASAAAAAAAAAVSETVEGEHSDKSSDIITFNCTLTPPSHCQRHHGYRTMVSFLQSDAILTSLTFFLKTRKQPPTTITIPRLITSPNLNSSAFPSSTSTTPFSLNQPNKSTLDEFEDGPLFRAKLRSFERRADNLRRGLKSIIKVLEQYHQQLINLVDSDTSLDQAFDQLDQLSPASFRPLKENYLQLARLYIYALNNQRISKLQSVILQPLKRIYDRLKNLEFHKKSFDLDSKLYYDYLTKYLSIKPVSNVDQKDHNFQQMKAKFGLSRISYHHLLYHMTILQESEVLEIMTNHQISQHDLLCNGTDLTLKGLKPLRSKLDALSQDLAHNRVELGTQKLSLETHRQVWVQKLDSEADLTNCSHLVNPKRSSSDHTTPSSTPHHNHRPISIHPTPPNLNTRINESQTTTLPSTSPKSLSPNSPPTITSPPTRSNELTEKLKGIAHSITGHTFQRDLSNSNHRSSEDSNPRLYNSCNRKTRHHKSSLPGESSTSITLSNSVRSCSMELPSTSFDPIMNPISSSKPLPTKTSPRPISTSSFSSIQHPSTTQRIMISEHAQEMLYESELESLSPSPSLPPPTSKKQGFLYSSIKPQPHQSHTHSHHHTTHTSERSWKKIWCVLEGGKFYEFLSNENSNENKLEILNKPINLKFATIKGIKGSSIGRRFCFEIITPKLRRTYQATMDLEMKEWIAAISASIESALNGTGSVRKFDSSKLREPSPIPPLPQELNMKTIKDKEVEDPSGHEERAINIASKETIEVVPNESQQGGFKRSLATRLIRKTSKLQSKSIPRSNTTASIQPPPRTRFTSSSKRPQSTMITSGIGHHRSMLPTLAPGHLGTNISASKSMTSIVPVSMSMPSNSLHLTQTQPHQPDEVNKDHQDEMDRSIEKAVHSLLHSHEDSNLSKQRNYEELNRLSATVPGNGRCAECGMRPARWASYNLGIFICIRCSGLHRGLGTLYSKVRSLDLDDWSDEQMRCMRLLGNSKSKQIWEGNLPDGFKVNDKNIAQFIKEKYILAKYKRVADVGESESAVDMDDDHCDKSKGKSAVDMDDDHCDRGQGKSEVAVEAEGLVKKDGHQGVIKDAHNLDNMAFLCEMI